MIFMQNDIKEFENNNLIKKHSGDMGFDIRSPKEIMIRPGCNQVIDTGLHVYIPPILAGIVQSRSGLAIKHNIEASNAGVIDSGFYGSIKVKLYNLDHNEPFMINFGDRIAQMIFHVRPEAYFNPRKILWVEYPNGFRITEKPIDEWPESERGSNGIGSSGVR